MQEPDAFDALFRQYWDRICALLFRICGDWDEAEDLALETFVRLYDRPPAREQNLTGWLYRVATNLGLNAIRGRQRRQYYEQQALQEAELDRGQSGYSQDPAEVFDRHQEGQRVRNILSAMKPRSALILVLHSTGLSYAEIAAAAQVAPSSVGTLLARAEREFAQLYRRSEI